MVYVVGGSGRRTLNLFAKLRKQGVCVVQWWDGIGRTPRWHTLDTEERRRATHLLLLKDFCSHAAESAGCRYAERHGMEVVRCRARDFGAMLTRLGITPLAEVVALPVPPTTTKKEEKIMGRKAKRKVYTAESMLTICRARAEGLETPAIAARMKMRQQQVYDQISYWKKKLGDEALLHAALETYAAQGGDMKLPMAKWSKRLLAGTLRDPTTPPLSGVAADRVLDILEGKPAPTPPKAVQVDPVDAAELAPPVGAPLVDQADTALAMALRQEDRADKAEAALTEQEALVAELRASLARERDATAAVRADLDIRSGRLSEVERLVAQLRADQAKGLAVQMTVPVPAIPGDFVDGFDHALGFALKLPVRDRTTLANAYAIWERFYPALGPVDEAAARSLYWRVLKVAADAQEQA